MKICILSQSGIAEEMIRQTKTVLEAVCTASFLKLEFCYGEPTESEMQDGIPSRETVDLCRTSDAVLFAVQEEGTYTKEYLQILRKKLGLFACMKPLRVFPALTGCAAIKEQPNGGTMDSLLIYEDFSEDMLPEKGEKIIDGDLCAYDVLLANSQIAQVAAKAAFRSAMDRRKGVIATDLREDMATETLRRRVVNIAASEFPEVALTRLQASQLIEQSIRNPGKADVILTDAVLGELFYAQNLVLTGVPHLHCAAYFGYGKQGLYYNVRPLREQSAEDTNPAALILAVAMLLRHSMGLEWEAQCMEKAVGKVLSLGRTADLNMPSLPTVSSSVFSAYIAQTAAEYLLSAE